MESQNSFSNNLSDSGESKILISKPHAPRAIPADRLPLVILNNIFLNLKLAEVLKCMVVCKRWMIVLMHDDSPVWKFFAKIYVPAVSLSDPYLLYENMSNMQKVRAFFFAWNPNDASRHVYIRSNGFTMHRHPIAQSTDGVRGKIGVISGMHAFDFSWDGPTGTVAVVGLATRHAALHCDGYLPLIGSDNQSWGWNIVDNTLLHNGAHFGPYPLMNNPPKYQIGEKIRLVLDCDRRQCYFEKDGEFLGLAFIDLPPVALYPAVCAVYGNTDVSMVYVGNPFVG